MPGDFWTIAFPAISAAFLAWIVEVVEAFTIILAVAALITLAGAISLLGPALQQYRQGDYWVSSIIHLPYFAGWQRTAKSNKR